jgi:hypothetical protein
MKNIPERFRNSISDDESSLSVDYRSSINAYTQIYNENKLYFFEEYTNHGIDHINAILVFSDKLIPEDTFSHFIDSQNCMVLILSVFLHDIGMHHTFQSFKDLVNETSICIPELDTKSWQQLWKEFVEKVNKYDAKKRKALFGDRNINITIPDFKSKDTLTGIHKKLIGEFIRIHHPRMAHEISMNGLRSDGNLVIKPVSNDRKIADLIGLIARSHGSSIRELFQYVKDKYTDTGDLNPLSIHVWYLMSVLRIADFIQIDKNRINLIPYRMSGYTSPVSNMEHIKHLSVDKVYFSEKDPETLLVIANPEDNVVFVELDSLLNAIQAELDLSWAILGEKYGREKYAVKHGENYVEKLNRPNLTLRRIKSNIQEPKYKSQELNYIPERIIFDASPDLPYLLVGPLYGEDVSYGVRELIQNSIDACYMRQRIENESNYLPEINVRIIYLDGRDDRFSFEISDNGIGMNADIVKNYFLKAGSTNRRSKEWELHFLNEDLTSNIARTGRFGVGLLSSFLIGDNILVETRKVGESYGLKFTASLTSENIKVLKTNTEFIGTKIQIPIRKKVLTQFKQRPQNNIIEWDKWYILREPKINYTSVLDKGTNLGYLSYFPAFNEEINNSIEFKIDGYNKIRLLFNSNIPAIVPEYSSYNLICNGIIIPKAPPFRHNLLKTPHVQVFDFDGNLPINLGRNSLDTKFLPFEDQILNLVYLDYLEKLISHDTVVNITEDKVVKGSGKIINHPFLNENFQYSSDFIYSKQGFILKSRKFIENIRFNKFIVIGSKDLKKDEVLSLDFKVNDDDLVMFKGTPHIFEPPTVGPEKDLKYLEVALYKKTERVLRGLISREVDKLRLYAKFFNKDKVSYKSSYYFGNIDEEGSPKLDYIEIFNNLLLIKKYIFGPISFENFLINFFDGENLMLPYNVKDRLAVFNKLKTNWLRKQSITMHKRY